ncbi:MAG: hypothetical protein COT74_00185 [Bdellovibrionales bacterium CG10_big_fil_rev_8_21_14_0_10_45_34]|nr:MAG: hypothetical protein COT74_00185 [Bdellovibrionales bacterium CG10_big_fil_rev_8_21_14_0_10_45_34]
MSFKHTLSDSTFARPHWEVAINYFFAALLAGGVPTLGHAMEVHDSEDDGSPVVLVTSEVTRAQANDPAFGEALEEAKKNIKVKLSEAQYLISKAESEMRSFYSSSLEPRLIDATIVDSPTVARTKNFLESQEDELDPASTTKQNVFFELRNSLESVRQLRQNFLFHSMMLTGTAAAYVGVNARTAYTGARAMFELAKTYGASKGVDLAIDDNLNNPKYKPKGVFDTIQFKFSKLAMKVGRTVPGGEALLSAAKYVDVFAKYVKRTSKTAMGAMTEHMGTIFIISSAGFAYYAYVEWSDMATKLAQIAEIEMKMEQTIEMYESMQLMNAP